MKEIRRDFKRTPETEKRAANSEQQADVSQRQEGETSSPPRGHLETLSSVCAGAPSRLRGTAGKAWERSAQSPLYCIVFRCAVQRACRLVNRISVVLGELSV